MYSIGTAVLKKSQERIFFILGGMARNEESRLTHGLTEKLEIYPDKDIKIIGGYIQKYTLGSLSL